MPGMEAIELVPYRTRIQHYLGAFKADESISGANKELVLRFVEHCFAEGLSPARIAKYLYTVRVVLQRYAFDLSQPREAALKALVARIQQDDYAYATKVDFNIFLKKFYKVLKDEKFALQLKWLKTGKSYRHEKLPSSLEKLCDALSQKGIHYNKD